jgi:hypothetical protein
MFGGEAPNTALPSLSTLAGYHSMHHSKLVYITCSPYLNSGVKLIKNQLHVDNMVPRTRSLSTVSKAKHVQM